MKKRLLIAAAPLAALASLGVASAAGAWWPGDPPSSSPVGACSPAVERRNLKVIEAWISNLRTDPGANAQLRSEDMTVTVPDSLPYGGKLSAADYEAAAVDMPIMEIFELEDGLVVSDTLFFFDTAQLVEALGTGEG